MCAYMYNVQHMQYCTILVHEQLHKDPDFQDMCLILNPELEDRSLLLFFAQD